MNRLVRFGAQALLPKKSGEKWLSPIVSRRVGNVLRKKAIREGTYGSVLYKEGKPIGGWDPSWDVHPPPAPFVGRPPKLHKNQRTRAERADKITAKLAEQPRRIEELRTAKASTSNTVEGILGLMKRLNSQGKKRRW
ncbi:unnamed protein product [Discosporangium mesarthrocarpum]